MPLYTFESPLSTSRASNQLVVADTSYLIALSDFRDKNHQLIINFHKAAIKNKTIFTMNVVTRQEFIKWVRKKQLLKAMVSLAASDLDIENRYKARIKLNSVTPLEEKHLASHIDSLHKEHIMAGDTHKLKPFLANDVWQEVQKLELQAQVIYFGGAGGMSWDDLGLAMAKYGLDATDSMIVNFAFFAGADAIVTTDCDYAQVIDDLDVYMPSFVALRCSVYDIAKDV